MNYIHEFIPLLGVVLCFAFACKVCLAVVKSGTKTVEMHSSGWCKCGAWHNPVSSEFPGTPLTVQKTRTDATLLIGELVAALKASFESRPVRCADELISRAESYVAANRESR